MRHFRENETEVGREQCWSENSVRRTTFWSYLTQVLIIARLDHLNATSSKINERLDPKVFLTKNNSQWWSQILTRKKWVDHDRIASQPVKGHANETWNFLFFSTICAIIILDFVFDSFLVMTEPTRHLSQLDLIKGWRMFPFNNFPNWVASVMLSFSSIGWSCTPLGWSSPDSMNIQVYWDKASRFNQSQCRIKVWTMDSKEINNYALQDHIWFSSFLVNSSIFSIHTNGIGNKCLSEGLADACFLLLRCCFRQDIC